MNVRSAPPFGDRPNLSLRMIAMLEWNESVRARSRPVLRSGTAPRSLRESKEWAPRSVIRSLWGSPPAFRLDPSDVTEATIRKSSGAPGGNEIPAGSQTPRRNRTPSRPRGLFPSSRRLNELFRPVRRSRVFETTVRYQTFSAVTTVAPVNPSQPSS